MENQHFKNLERIIKQMLTPVKDLPLYLIIESICGKEVAKFDLKIATHKKLLNNLIIAVNNACIEINKKGIIRNRPNEVGNDVEIYIKDALNKIKNYEANSPKTKAGKLKSTGYPDIELKYSKNDFCYIECKTYNIENINTTQRSFYLSPSDDFKVNHNGIHFIISLEVSVEKRIKANNLYKTNSWKILDAYNLYCDVKYEFNSDNKRMYNKNLILAEGQV